MKLGMFRLGMRTFKTGLSVMVIIALFAFLHRGNPMIASLAAVFSLRQDFETTLEFSKSRVIGNAIGGIFAITYFFVFDLLHESQWVTIIVVPLLLMLLISINDGLNNNKGLIGSVAAFLMISLTIPEGASYMYAIERVFDTFLGTMIAIVMNIGVHPRDAATIAADLADRQRHSKK